MQKILHSCFLFMGFFALSLQDALFFHNSKELSFKDTVYEPICRKEMEIYKKHDENDDIPPIPPVPQEISCFCPDPLENLASRHKMSLYSELGAFCLKVEKNTPEKDLFEAMLFHRLAMESSDEIWSLSTELGKEKVLQLHQRFKTHNSAREARLNASKRLHSREAEFIKTHPLLKAKILFFLDGIAKVFSFLEDINKKIGSLPLLGNLWKLGLGEMVSQATSVASNMNSLVQGQIGIFDAMKNVALDKMQVMMEKTQAAMELADEM